VATALINIGAIYKNQGDNQMGLKYYFKSLKIREEIGWKKGVAVSLMNIGILYLKKQDLKKAEEYATKAMDLSTELGYPELIKSSAFVLNTIYRKQDLWEKALQMYELHIQMRDSIMNEETQKATIRQQTKYEFEKAQLIKDQEKKEEKRKMEEAQSRRDNLQYSVIIIVIVALFLSLLSVRPLGACLPDRQAVRPVVAEGLVFFVFLIFFEFLLVLADPYIENWSGGAPGIKLLFNAGIAALIFPMHAFFESKLKGRLVKK